MNHQKSSPKKILTAGKSAKNGKGGIISNSRGLTLIELLISLIISLLVVAAAGFILLTQSGVIRLNRSVSKEQQRLNTAFNTVRYSLRMAGFDYAQSYFIQPGAVSPVQIVTANYPTNPYEVLISYDLVQNPANLCTITAVPAPNGGSASSEFDLGQYCNINNFYTGQVLNVTNIIPLKNQPPPPPPIILCVTATEPQNNKPYGRIQVNPGSTACSISNKIPPKSIQGTTVGVVSPVNQVLFYWGNTGYNFNAPFNVPGNLYECSVNPAVFEPPAVVSYAAPSCLPNTTIILSDYINNFNVTGETAQTNNNFNPAQPYLYYLSITGESDAALSDSPSYSVDVPYNGNPNGINAMGKAGQIIGNNVLKTLNTSVFLKNVYYGY